MLRWCIRCHFRSAVFKWMCTFFILWLLQGIGSGLVQYVIELLSDRSDSNEFRRHGLPWYVDNASGYRPSAAEDPPVQDVWPSDRNAGDRIEAQLMIAAADNENETMKMIYLPHGLEVWDVEPGRERFVQQKCPVDRCILTGSEENAATADAILFKSTHDVGSIAKFPKLQFHR